MIEKLLAAFIAWFVVVFSIILAMAVIAQFHDWGVWK